jgi:hypothetical protein
MNFTNIIGIKLFSISNSNSSMSKKSSQFGQPKPLPGQAGYKLSNTEVLEKESSEMESRLKMLQV